MIPSLSERLVTIANRLGASFHAAVRAAREEWRSMVTLPCGHRRHAEGPYCKDQTGLCHMAAFGPRQTVPKDEAPQKPYVHSADCERVTHPNGLRPCDCGPNRPKEGDELSYTAKAYMSQPEQKPTRRARNFVPKSPGSCFDCSNCDGVGCHNCCRFVEDFPAEAREHEPYCRMDTDHLGNCGPMPKSPTYVHSIHCAIVTDPSTTAVCNCDEQEPGRVCTHAGCDQWNCGVPSDGASTVDSFKDSRANPGDRLPGGKSTPAAVDGSEGVGAGMEAGMALPPRPATTGAPAPDEPDPRYAEHDERCTCTRCRGLEGARPAPSSTKCSACQDGWVMGHACKDEKRQG